MQNSDPRTDELLKVGLNSDKFWKIIWKQIVQEIFLFQNQFHVKICCVLKVSDQNLTCGKKDVSKFDMLQNFPIPKKTNCLKLTENLTYFEILDSKSDALLKTCFKTCFFLESLDSKTVFFLFFLYIMVFDKSHNWGCWRSCGIEGSKSDFLQANHSSKSLFIQIKFTSKCDLL